MEGSGEGCREKEGLSWVGSWIPGHRVAQSQGQPKPHMEPMSLSEWGGGGSTPTAWERAHWGRGSGTLTLVTSS